MKKDEQNDDKIKRKKERAKKELIIYGIFFVGIIIFVKILEISPKKSDVENKPEITNNFISEIKDNYEYNTLITLNDTIYEYYGKVLGNNSTINLKLENEIKKYYLMNKKYYVKENDNYILITEEEVYPYINFRYLNIENIKMYIKLGVKENNTYKIKISDLVLGNDNDECVKITIDEVNKSIIIDYTSLFKLNDKNIDRLLVNISYNNIGNIISLDE